MIKKLLKLEVLVIALSLIFVSFACSDDDDDDNNNGDTPSVNEPELSEGKVNYGVVYSGGAFSLSFEKGNKLVFYSEEGSAEDDEMQVQAIVFKISALTPTETANEYKITIKDCISARVVITTADMVAKANADGRLGTDWKLNVPKDVSLDPLKEVFGNEFDNMTKELLGTFIVSISEDKNSITLAPESDPTAKSTFTYHQ